MDFDLFTYPHAPGYREPTTSKAAAKAVANEAGKLRERVFETIRDAGPSGLSADQAASLLGRTVLSVRPRVTELAKAERITRTGERRANESSLRAHVWRVPQCT